MACRQVTEVIAFCCVDSHDVHDSPGRRLYDNEVPVQLSSDARRRQHSPRRASTCSRHHHLQPQLRRQQVEPSQLYVRRLYSLHVLT